MDQELALVFDGQCGFCTAAVHWLTRLDRAGRVRPVPCQRPGAPEAFGLRRKDCEVAAWAIEPGGRRHRGGAAAVAALAWALGRPELVRLYYAPGLRQAIEAVYRLVARLRPYLPGTTPYCAEHPDDCADPGGPNGGCRPP
jgi:predicted DCC family thiol-disulfide oxidoreductase YuxK